MSIDDLIMSRPFAPGLQSVGSTGEYLAQLDVFASDVIADTDVAREYPEGTVLSMRVQSPQWLWEYAEVEPSCL